MLNWQVTFGIGLSWAAVTSVRMSGRQGFFTPTSLGYSPGLLCQGFRPSPSRFFVLSFSFWSWGIYNTPLMT
jgi:hypothetical protein